MPGNYNSTFLLTEAEECGLTNRVLLYEVPPTRFFVDKNLVITTVSSGTY